MLSLCGLVDYLALIGDKADNIDGPTIIFILSICDLWRVVYSQLLSICDPVARGVVCSQLHCIHMRPMRVVCSQDIWGGWDLWLVRFILCPVRVVCSQGYLGWDLRGLPSGCTIAHTTHCYAHTTDTLLIEVDIPCSYNTHSLYDYALYMKNTLLLQSCLEGTDG